MSTSNKTTDTRSTPATPSGRGNRGNRRTDRVPGATSLLAGPDQQANTALVAAGLLVVGLLLAVIGFGRPAQTSSPTNVPLQQAGTFGYAATVRPGTFYGSTTVGTGEPLYSRLIRTVRVSYTGQLPAGVTGRATLNAVVSDGNGWQRTIRLAGPVDVHTAQFSLTGPLDLTAIQALTTQYATQSGAANASFTVALQADLALAGQVAGTPVRATLTPSVAMRYDASGLLPPQANTSSSSASASAKSNPFQVTQSVPAQSVGLAPARVSLLGLVRLPVTLLRGLGVAGLLLGLGGLALVGLARRRTRGEDPVTAIRRRFGDLVVPALAPTSTGTTVWVASIDDLAALARRYENAVIHATGAEGDTFSVYDGTVTYRYALPQPHPRTAGPAEANEFAINGRPARHSR